jgi:glycosyltransferase involved in cell wall biosynthesis
MPKLSIITPVYNTELFLADTIQSILAQTYLDFELILVNDGSTDGSGTLCDQFAQKDSRIRVIHKENGGVASARNVGLDNAKGDYIGWVDSDDRISPVMYQILMQSAEKYRADIVQCENKRHWDMLQLEIPNPMPEPEITDGLGSLKRIHRGRYPNYMALWSKVYRRSLFDGVRFTEGQAFEDDEIVPGLLFKGKTNVFYDSLVLYQYVFRENSIVGSGGRPEHVVTLISHLEKRMDWFKTLDPTLYDDARKYFFRLLATKYCEARGQGTIVQAKCLEMLKKHKKDFWSIIHPYERVALLLLYCGKKTRKWVADSDFAPIQRIIGRIKGSGS